MKMQKNNYDDHRKNHNREKRDNKGKETRKNKNQILREWEVTVNDNLYKNRHNDEQEGE